MLVVITEMSTSYTPVVTVMDAYATDNVQYNVIYTELVFTYRAPDGTSVYEVDESLLERIV